MSATEEEQAIAALREELSSLKKAVGTRVHRQLHQEKEKAKTVRSFIIKSLATIVGWFTAQTISVCLLRAFASVDATKSQQSFYGYTVNAVFVSIAVPICLFMLTKVHFKKEEGITIRQSLVEIMKAGLPCVVSWAWNDWTKSVVALSDAEVWPQALAAVLLTIFVSISELLPCFETAMVKLKQRDPTAGLLAQFEVLPKYFALACGYAWNSLFREPITRLQELVDAPLFVFMLQVVYFVLITSFISFAQKMWSRRLKQKKEQQPEDDEQPNVAYNTTQASLEVVGDRLIDMIEMSSHIIMESLHFVYAWALLDTINALFFTFLLGCSGATTCGYPSNFGFAMLITPVFTLLADQLATEDRRSEWNMAAANLLVSALSLCVGWAWANFCKTAISSALDIDMTPVEATWFIALAFVWLSCTGLYHRFEVEHNAWHRKYKEDAIGHGVAKSLDLTHSPTCQL